MTPTGNTTGHCCKVCVAMRSGKDMVLQELYSLNMTIYGYRRDPLHYSEISHLRIVPPRKDQSVGNIMMQHMGRCAQHLPVLAAPLPPRRASRYLRVPDAGYRGRRDHAAFVEFMLCVFSARNQPATTHPLCNMYSANFVVVVYRRISSYLLPHFNDATFTPDYAAREHDDGLSFYISKDWYKNGGAPHFMLAPGRIVRRMCMCNVCGRRGCPAYARRRG